MSYLNSLTNMLDLELIRAYNNGVNICAKALFERHKVYLDRLCKKLPSPNHMDFEEKREIAYLKFIQVLPKYENRNNASFKTYLSVCIKNAFRDLIKVEKTRRKNRKIEFIPFDSIDLQGIIEKISYNKWRQLTHNP